ncbi:diacylglycerol/lipid kinase family protein [Limosilactobacillus oris]|uniref:diacylglycerol/lipid kinase family protein n=1 Tax=Limosilactobacillus oris TaxID=1632 RepID=UPI00265A25C1|nr:diacylglycerol kinase family protein [Limosilactobacillus oris]
MHYSIILNPTAGNGNGSRVWPGIQQQLVENQVDFSMQATKDETSAAYFARRLATARHSTKTTVLVIGGDGTLHDVLNSLIANTPAHAQQLPLAYIPVSKLSRFARAYGISLDPAGALQQVLATEASEQVHIGHYHDAIKDNDGYFLNSIGIGFDAALLNQRNQASKRQKFRWSRLAFFSRATAILYNQQPFQLMLNGTTGRLLSPKAYIAMVANHPFTDSRIQLTTTGGLHENSLDLIVAERRGWPLTFWQLYQFYRGRLASSRWAIHQSGTNFHLTTTSLEFCQVDGEPMGNRFLDMTITSTSYPFLQQH